MKEYIKLFESLNSADGYIINDIPFITTVKRENEGLDPQNVRCNEEGKKLVAGPSGVVIEDVGPEMVDLGLPGGTLWAEYNLGATAPEGVGKYYQWGGITDVENISCSWSTCPHTNGTYSSSNKKVFTKYVPTSGQAEYWGGEGDADNLTVIQTVDDVAQIKYNPKWRIPTERDFRILLNNTTQTIETIGTTKGIRFTSTVEGYTDKSIFIPYSGEKTGNNYINVNTNAFIWESTLLSEAPNAAFAFNLTDSTITNTTRSRYIGMSIRPVCNPS